MSELQFLFLVIAGFFILCHAIGEQCDRAMQTLLILLLMIRATDRGVE